MQAEVDERDIKAILHELENVVKCWYKSWFSRAKPPLSSREQLPFSQAFVYYAVDISLHDFAVHWDEEILAYLRNILH